MLSRLRVRDYAPRSRMPPHDHAEDSISIVMKGEFVEHIGSCARNYTRGHIAFFPARERHSQEFGVAGARQIIFTPRAGWLDYLADGTSRLEDAPHLRASTFVHLGDRLLEEIVVGDAFSAIACEGILLEIVSAFGRNRAAARISAKAPAWLCAARDFMHANAFVPLSIAQIARAAGRHEVHLAREFRRFFGVPPGAYLRRLRIEHAAHLLSRPNAAICEIALDCGFSSHAHLCREFKAKFGVTPSQYRSQRAGK